MSRWIVFLIFNFILDFEYLGLYFSMHGFPRDFQVISITTLMRCTMLSLLSILLTCGQLRHCRLLYYTMLLSSIILEIHGWPQLLLVIMIVPVQLMTERKKVLKNPSDCWEAESSLACDCSCKSNIWCLLRPYINIRFTINSHNYFLFKLLNLSALQGLSFMVDGIIVLPTRHY